MEAYSVAMEVHCNVVRKLSAHAQNHSDWVLQVVNVHDRLKT